MPPFALTRRLLWPWTREPQECDWSWTRPRLLLSLTDALDITTDADGRARTILASLADATNPTVFITSGFVSTRNYPPAGHYWADASRPHRASPARVRHPGPSPASASSSHSDTDIFVHAISMGVLHNVVPMAAVFRRCDTRRAPHGVGVGLALAEGKKGVHGGVDQDWASERGGGCWGRARGDGEVRSVKIVRTGRRAMKGVVWW
ncbi:hypothetical protein FIBSPDRAFT_533395 [Athelia psychrophila]|uniref:Uncharacterized protein n=1 Tax=Athelia psychrophila TaxID=1759441 RepID=A0A166JAL6_9AGAM|nr:hypothetical protein FIBSPDRAFT_533395 [Fibularhizoctonia sp. CBS 109695]